MFEQKWSKTKPPKGVLLNKGHPLTKGLVGCWLFNEGSGKIVQDLSGNGKTGTFSTVNKPIWTLSPYGSAIVIPPDFGKITSTLVPPSSSYTVAFLAKISTSANNSIFYLGNSGYPLFIANVGGKILFFANGVNTYRYFEAAGNTLLTDGSYHSVALVYTGDVTTTQLYIDSQPVASDTTSGTTLTTTPDMFGWGSNGNYGVDYTIVWGVVFNRALSASEIAQLYREPFAMFNKARLWGAAAAGNIKKIAGVSWASVKKVSGVAVASIKKITGITAS